MRGDEKAKVVGTLIGKSRRIRDLLGQSLALTHDIVGVPPHNKSVGDEPQPASSLEILVCELVTIQERAEILFGQLERIKGNLGPSTDD